MSQRLQFERRPHGPYQSAAALTPAGDLFLRHAYRIAAELERALTEVRRLHAGATGHVCVGFIHAATFSVLPALLQRFRAERPGVVLDLSQVIICVHMYHTWQVPNHDTPLRARTHTMLERSRTGGRPRRAGRPAQHEEGASAPYIASCPPTSLCPAAVVAQ